MRRDSVIIAEKRVEVSQAPTDTFATPRPRVLRFPGHRASDSKWNKWNRRAHESKGHSRDRTATCGDVIVLSASNRIRNASRAEHDLAARLQLNCLFDSGRALDFSAVCIDANGVRRCIAAFRGRQATDTRVIEHDGVLVYESGDASPHSKGAAARFAP